MYDQSEEKPKIDCTGSWKLYKSGAKLRAKKQGGVTPIDSILPPTTGVKLNGQSTKLGGGQRSKPSKHW